MNYEFNCNVYTIEKLSNGYQMTVYDYDDMESYGISDASLIINVLLNGKKLN